MLSKRDPCDRLDSLDAMSAIKAWLLGDYGRGEERVLILAIRRELGLELTDAEIRGVLVEAANDNAAAMSVFRRLLLLESAADEEFAICKPREASESRR
jgi:hypothetical protein